MIDIDIRQVVHLLKMKVAGVIEHIAARMVIDPLQETLEGHAVMQVFAGMDFVADIHALFVKNIQQRSPAPGQFIEGLIEKRLIMRRPRIKIRPRQRPGKGGMRLQPQTRRGHRRLAYFFYRPLLARLRVTAQRGGRKRVKGRIISRMNGHQLPLKMGGQLADRQALFRQDTAHLIAVGLARGGAFNVENRRMVTGDLQCLIAQTGGPLRQALQGIKRRLRADKLRQENARSFDCFHTTS